MWSFLHKQLFYVLTAAVLFYFLMHLYRKINLRKKLS
jgi:hypothetical protein